MKQNNTKESQKMKKRIHYWGFSYWNGKNQIGAQVGFDGPDVGTKSELIFAMRIARKLKLFALEEILHDKVMNFA